MSLDVKKAIKIPFTAPNWKFKVGLPVLFILIIYTLFSVWHGKNIWIGLTIIAFWVITTGYYGIYAHNEINNNPEPLPAWNLLKCTVIGLQSYAIILAYGIISLPLLIIFYCLVVSSFVTQIIAIITGIPILIILLTYSPVPFSLFFENYKISEAFNFSKILKICKVGYKDYIIFAVWSIIIGIIIGFSTGICASLAKHLISRHLTKPITVVGINFLITLITLNLSAQTYKIVLNKLSLPMQDNTDGSDLDAYDIAKNIGPNY